MCGASASGCGRCGSLLREVWKSLKGSRLGVISGSPLAYEDDFGTLSEPFRRRKATDGKCDGYMRGLGGAQRRKTDLR